MNMKGQTHSASTKARLKILGLRRVSERVEKANAFAKHRHKRPVFDPGRASQKDDGK